MRDADEVQPSLAWGIIIAFAVVFYILRWIVKDSQP